MSDIVHFSHLVCQCTSPEHTMQWVYFDNDPNIYALVHLNHLPFWQRLWVAIRYICGYSSKYGCFEEFCLRPEDVGKLVDVLEIAQPEPMLTEKEAMDKLKCACQGKQDDTACCAVAGLMAAGRKIDCVEDPNGLTISIRSK
jgi:hypothetical protein